MLDVMENEDKIVATIGQIFESNGVDKYDIITSFNWGGTIAGLWIAYKKYASMYPESTFLAHFEEDFRPINDEWFVDSTKKLKKDIIYVGEHNKNRLNTGNDDTRISAPIFKNTRRLGNPEMWIGGGYYFSTLGNFKIIEKHIGIFHKGDQKTKYDHTLDGISIGEVGFPTLCYHSKLKFDFLIRKYYFKHY